VPYNYLCGAEKKRGGPFTAAAAIWAFFAWAEPPDGTARRTAARSRQQAPAECDAAALVDKDALGDYPPNDIFSRQYPRHFVATLTRILASDAICGVKLL